MKEITQPLVSFWAFTWPRKPRKISGNCEFIFSSV